jgi:serine/threonine protein kinase
MTPRPDGVEGAAPDLAGFRFLRHLGSGGYAHVYLYEQEMPERKVAVKVLKDNGLSDEIRAQFTSEANAMAGLADHPYIVHVFGAAVADDGRPYLVMQYYPKPNLSVRARRRQFSTAEVLQIGIQIGSAVETAHRRGILHRDIKPANVLTGQFGAPGLTDFGIAVTKGDNESADPEGMSVPWSPPEVLFGSSEPDERSDIYSLAATLWHLLTGRSPFEQPGGDNSTAALMRRIGRDPPSPIGRGDLPDSLERLLGQAMGKQPLRRPQSALAFIRSLQGIEQEQRLPLTTIVVADEQDDEEPDEDAEGGHERATKVRAPQRIVAQPKPQPPAIVSASAAPRTEQQSGLASAGTVRRPVVVPVGEPTPSADPPTPSTRRASRYRGAALVAAIVVGIVLAVAITQRDRESIDPSEPTAGGQSALPAVAVEPGIPVVTAKRVDARTVRFGWTYGNRLAGDVVRWHRVDGEQGRPRSGATRTSSLLLRDAGGGERCLRVRVVRKDGQASPWSDPVCR